MRIERYEVPLIYSTELTVSMDIQAIPRYINREFPAGAYVVAIYCENSSLIPQFVDRKFRIEHTNNEVPIDFNPKYIGSDQTAIDQWLHVFEIS